MLSYIVRRLLLLFPTLIGMTVVVFCVMALAPGGIGASVLSREGTMRPRERQAVEEYLDARYGLSLPLPIQYGRWLNKVSPVGFRVWAPGDAEVKASKAKKDAMLQKPRAEVEVVRAERDALSSDDAAARVKRAALGDDIRRREAEIRKVHVHPEAGDIKSWLPIFKAVDLGDSIIRRRPVMDLIVECLPITLLMNGITFPIVYGIAILVGIHAAKNRAKAFDVISGTALLALFSVPTILAGVIGIGFFASSQYPKLFWFPSNGLHDLLADDMRFLPSFGGTGGTFERGYLLDFGWHLALPLICIAYTQFAVLSKLARGAVLENVQADYARTARAKGLLESQVLYRHVFRNSLLPLITVAAAILPAMLSGSLIVETIFGINGMGRLTVNAVLEKDPEMVLSTTLVSALLGLIGYLLADIGYAIADPRVSYDG